jgi:transcriptional regulator with XRE-family HTH domain
MLRVKDLMYGDKLKALRGEQLQTWVATKLGIRQERLSDYENGKIPFGDEDIRKVCGYFRISVAEFKRPVLTPSLSALLLGFEELALLKRPRISLGTRLLDIFLRRRVKVLEKENFELLWRLEQFQAAMESIERRSNPQIYVMV